MFALVDCNNFYASCERVFQPQLHNKPVAILSNNDGCVIARSDEAKALGLPMGAPAFKYASFFKTHDVKVFSSNYPLYGDMSGRVMKILEQFTPDIEVYSIDEAFLQFKGYDDYDLSAYGLQIRKRVLKWTGIPTCVGLAPTKALAKIANKIARKYPKETQGVHCIDSEEKRIKALKWTPIEKVWGIGFRHSKRLKAMGVHTASDFIKLPDSWVKKHMAIVGLRLKKELLGETTLALEQQVNTKKAIATTRTFENELSDFKDVKERISTFAINCAEKLRTQKSVCTALYVFIKTNRFKKDTPYKSYATVLELPYPTNSSISLSKYAIKALSNIYKEKQYYKKAGVIVMGLTPHNNKQFMLFENENPKHQTLMQTIDQINKNYSTAKVKIGQQDIKRTWKMRQQHLSKKFTTNINDIITVKCQ